MSNVMDKVLKQLRKEGLPTSSMTQKQLDRAIELLRQFMKEEGENNDTL